MDNYNQNLYTIPDELFEPIHISCMWAKERDNEEYPTTKLKVVPYIWDNQKKQVSQWKISFMENEDNDSLAMNIVNLQQLYKYIEFIFSTLYYDTQEYDSINIMLPNLPLATIDSTKIHNTEYKNKIQKHICEYIESILSIWPVNNSKEDKTLTPIKYGQAHTYMFSISP
jgi:hypothetical protein